MWTELHQLCRGPLADGKRCLPIIGWGATSQSEDNAADAAIP